MTPKPQLIGGPVDAAGEKLDRREAVAAVLGENASEFLIITGISAPKGDVLPVIGAEAPNLFPTGSMGCAAMVGLDIRGHHHWVVRDGRCCDCHTRTVAANERCGGVVCGRAARTTAQTAGAGVRGQCGRARHQHMRHTPHTPARSRAVR